MIFSSANVTQHQTSKQAKNNRPLQPHEIFRHARPWQFPSNGRKHAVVAERMRRLSRALSRFDKAGTCLDIFASTRTILREVCILESEYSRPMQWSQRTVKRYLAHLRRAGIEQRSGIRRAYGGAKWGTCVRRLHAKALLTEPVRRESGTLIDTNAVLNLAHNTSTTKRKPKEKKHSHFDNFDAASRSASAASCRDDFDAQSEPKPEPKATPMPPVREWTEKTGILAILQAFNRPYFPWETSGLTGPDEPEQQAGVLGYLLDRFNKRKEFKRGQKNALFPVSYFLKARSNFVDQFDLHVQDAIVDKWTDRTLRDLVRRGIRYDCVRKDWVLLSKAA